VDSRTLIAVQRSTPASRAALTLPEAVRVTRELSLRIRGLACWSREQVAAIHRFDERGHGASGEPRRGRLVVLS
jgi:hypothetical protein